MKKLIALSLLILTPTMVLADKEKNRENMVAPPKVDILPNLTANIISISGGVEQVASDLEEDEDGLQRGFVKIKGAAGGIERGYYDNDQITYFLPYELKLDDQGDIEVSIGAVESENGGDANKLTVLKNSYTERDGNIKIKTTYFGGQKEISIFRTENGGAYLGLIGKGELGYEHIETVDGERHYGFQAVYGGGITAGLIGNNYKIDASSIYEVTDTHGDELDRQGLVQIAGFTYEFNSGKQLEIFYEYDDNASEFINPNSGEVIDPTKIFRNTHNASIRLNF